MELRKGKDEKENGKERVEKGKEEEKKKPGFAAKAVLAAGVMLAAATGCSDRITNNYNYNCPDGEARDTVEEVAEDTATEPDVPEAVDAVVEPVEDVLEEDAGEEECIADLAPTTCDYSEPIADGVLSLSESLEAGNLTFALDGTEEHPETGDIGAIISIFDECGNLLKRDKCYEGTTKWFSVAGAEYAFTVDVIYHSEEDPWVDASIRVNCYPSSLCHDVEGWVMQGETLIFGSSSGSSYGAHLADIDVASVPGEPAAILDIIDESTGAVMDRLRIPRGEHEYFAGYRIDITNLVAGYTFGAKWAEISIRGPCD